MVEKELSTAHETQKVHNHFLLKECSIKARCMFSQAPHKIFELVLNNVSVFNHPGGLLLIAYKYCHYKYELSMIWNIILLLAIDFFAFMRTIKITQVGQFHLPNYGLIMSIWVCSFSTKKNYLLCQDCRQLLESKPSPCKYVCSPVGQSGMSLFYPEVEPGNRFFL